MQAIITGDIVNSTALAPAAEKKLIRLLRQVLQDHRFEFYRGDSFQVYLQNAAAALPLALRCRAAAIGLGGGAAVASSDVRVSIGAGKIKTPGASLGISKGEAFVLSGRAFDEMVKQDTRLAISAGNALANEGLQVIADYGNAIFKDMTSKQALVIFELLKGGTQQDAATKLKKSKSTIHQHVSAGRWPEIEKLLDHYKNIIRQLS